MLANLPQQNLQIRREKIKKAQNLYEPWMDGKESSKSENGSYVPSPARIPEQKKRSNYKFDDEYLKNLSESSDIFKQVRSRMAGSASSTVSLHLPKTTESMRSTPTPAPIMELESKVVTAGRRSKTPGRLQFVDRSTNTSAAGKLRTLSPASLDLISNSLEPFAIMEDYTEFYEWVFDGKRGEIQHHEIERLLFGKVMTSENPSRDGDDRRSSSGSRKSSTAPTDVASIS